MEIWLLLKQAQNRPAADVDVGVLELRRDSDVGESVTEVSRSTQIKGVGLLTVSVMTSLDPTLLGFYPLYQASLRAAELRFWCP